MSEEETQRIYNTSQKATVYTGAILDQHAMRVAADCEAVNTEGKKAATLLPLDDELYVIPITVTGLPPMPRPDVIDRTVLGVDMNKNCVRDDVEHFIFDGYGENDQATLRKHMYEHAIWLRFYLIENISERTLNAVARQLLKTGLCLNKQMGSSEGQRAQTEIFALLHNTEARTNRYFANEDILDGFDVDINAPPGC